MCPLRFILVFLSAVLAGYFAWSSVRSSHETTMVSQDSSSSQTTSSSSSSSEDEQQFNFKRMVADGFWVFVDMASGRYLWRNLTGKKYHEDVKDS